MKRFNRRELIKLASIAGTGVLLPRQIYAAGSIFEGIKERISEGIKGTIGKDIELPPPIPGVRFAMVIDLEIQYHLPNHMLQ